PPVRLKFPVTTKPSNPNNTPVEETLRKPLLVNKPVPVIVPESVVASDKLVPGPFPIKGLSPKGSIQFEFIVFVPLVCSILTKLKVTPLQFNIAVEFPSKIIVPLL